MKLSFSFLALSSAAILLVLSKQSTASVATSSRVQQADDQDSRRLVISDFAPPFCNNNMTPCTTWTASFGTNSSYTNRVSIPCGTCITMDFPGDKLTLQGGIDIRGKLVFPDGYKLTVETTMITVQGELQITSSKPVNGVPDIVFLMVGDTDQFFTPIDSNTNACGGTDCNVAKKSVTVAGGKVNFNGLPPNTPTWTRLYDVVGTNPNSPSTIVVPNTVKGKWAVGAEVLITSHTVNWNDQQKRTITSVVDSTEAGYVNLVLNKQIVRPTTQKESTDFAVEIALLSRNILFLGGTDATTFHGGHFWVMQTPTVAQIIQGVEFRNFGQQGKLGRYPIHFHLCSDVSGSIVAKNTIRQSNQRCVVVHGTNNLQVQENIAYDTKGHCFMLEDGIETDNKFIRNLGALTAKPNRIIPNLGPNGDESDMLPSTFWITNPTNSFEGNVAAGSAGSGFWFELLVRGPRAYLFPGLDPKKLNLTLFKDNVVHSNLNRGLRTYPTGYNPDSYVSFDGLKAYRNNSTGLFIHNSDHIKVVGGLFADNVQLSIDLDKAESIIVQDSRIIGQSQTYAALMQTQGARPICQSDLVVGIESHTWKTRDYNGGIFMNNVEFTGFKDILCPTSVAFRFDQSIQLKMFELPTTMKSIVLEPGTDVADFCWTKGSGVVDAFIIDVSGSMGPTGSGSGVPATLLSDDPSVLHFVDSTKCIDMATQCYSYCQDTCIRPARFEIESYGTDGYTLKLCKQTDGNDCFSFPSFYYPGNGEEIDVGRATEFRVMTANLPPGKYVASILDGSSATSVWPTFVRVVLDETYCANTIAENDITVSKPDLSDIDGSCANLIRNGDVEASRNTPLYWHHRGGGIKIGFGQGTNGSNAVTHLSEEFGGNDAIGQFVDTRCLEAMKGRYYEFSAKIKLIKESDGSIFRCDPQAEVCPAVSIDTRTRTISNFANIVYEYGDSSEFQLVHGLLYVNEDITASDSVFLYIARRRDDVTLFVDDMSFNLLPLDKPTSPTCANAVYNGNFSTGDTRFWTNDGAQTVNVISDSYDNSSTFALKMLSGGMHSQLRPGCLGLGQLYEVSIKYRVLDARGVRILCKPESTSVCPGVRLLAYAAGTLKANLLGATHVFSESPTASWSTLIGSFVATPAIIMSDNLQLTFSTPGAGYSLVVDNVEVSTRRMDSSRSTCLGNLLLNSDMEAGYAGYWTNSGSGIFSNITGFRSPSAILYSDRVATTDGPAYLANTLIDSRCIRPGWTYEVNAEVKLMDTNIPGKTVACDPTLNCPKVRLLLRDQAATLIAQLRLRSYDLTNGTWVRSSFNHLRQSFTLPENWDGTISAFSIDVREFPIQWDVILDDFTLTRVLPETPRPSSAPSRIPSLRPSNTPTLRPSAIPSVLPSGNPSGTPSHPQSNTPTTIPSVGPSAKPSDFPSWAPSEHPTVPPSRTPSHSPSRTPTVTPSLAPSLQPTGLPTSRPSRLPSLRPSTWPSASPTMKPTLSECSGNLIFNSDMELGYAGYWAQSVNGTISNFSPGYQSPTAFLSGSRVFRSDGPMYLTAKHFEYRCLRPSKKYEIRAMFRLMKKGTGKPLGCDPATTCPRVRVTLRNKASLIVIDDSLLGYNIPNGVWNSTGFNQFQQVYTLPSTWDGSIQTFRIHIRDFNTEWDIVVDDFSMRIAH